MSHPAEAFDGHRKGLERGRRPQSPAQAWFVKTTADEARRLWVSLAVFLFTSLAVAPGPYPWVLAAFPVVGAGLRAAGWHKIRCARAWQPALSAHDLRRLRAVFFRQHAVFDLFGLTVAFLGLVDLPPKGPSYLLTLAAAGWWISCLSLDLLLLHRDSEPGGWGYSLGRWLRRYSRRSEGGLWALLVVKLAFALPYVHTRLLGGEAERSVVLSLWLLLAVYLGVRTPALAFPPSGDGGERLPRTGDPLLLSPGDARPVQVQ